MLNFNANFFFFCSKAFPGIFSQLFLEHSINKLYSERIELNVLFRLSYLNSNFALTLGYLNPGSRLILFQISQSDCKLLIPKQKIQTPILSANHLVSSNYGNARCTFQLFYKAFTRDQGSVFEKKKTHQTTYECALSKV